MRRRAFSLIELLVVTSIIAMLVAMLLPALREARTSAKSVVCLSNLRQIALGHIAYSADYFGVHPPSSTNASDPHWLELINQYVSTDQIRYCPETAGYTLPNPSGSGFAQVWGSRTRRWWLNVNTYGVGFDGGGSYGVNIHTHSTTGWGNDIDRHFRTEGMSTEPTNIPLLGDCIWHNSYPLSTNAPPTTEPAATATQPVPLGVSLMGRYVIRRHYGAINMSFLDGSARHVNLEDLWDLTWHRGYVHRTQMPIPY
ncbi:MAG: prepilin-type N-terminal cleavage/methylation domain-containing protein [Planctomycetes bacterium]|nr:prepilin-type N-terminal cleavage/methylation domain-containing protein [Planctomycetota bacterium]